MRLRYVMSAVTALGVVGLAGAGSVAPAHAAGEFTGSLISATMSDSDRNGRLGQGETETVVVRFTVPATSTNPLVTGSATGWTSDGVRPTVTCTAGAAAGNSWSLAGVAGGTTVDCTAAFTALQQPTATRAVFSVAVADTGPGTSGSVSSGPVQTSYAPAASIAKSASPSPVAPGQSLTWSILVTNTSAFTDHVVLTDPALPGWASCLGGGGWSCDAAIQDGSATFDLPAGASATFSYWSQTPAESDPGGTDPEINTATYALRDGSVTGPQLSTGSATATVPKKLDALRSASMSSTGQIFEGAQLSVSYDVVIAPTGVREVRIVDPWVSTHGGRILCSPVTGVTFSGDAQADPAQSEETGKTDITCQAAWQAADGSWSTSWPVPADVVDAALAQNPDNPTLALSARITVNPGEATQSAGDVSTSSTVYYGDLEPTVRAVLATDVNGNGLADAGDTVAWSASVQNSGNVTLSNINLGDQVPGDATCTATNSAGDVRGPFSANDNPYLEAGERMDCNASVQLGANPATIACHLDYPLPVTVTPSYPRLGFAPPRPAPNADGTLTVAATPAQVPGNCTPLQVTKTADKTTAAPGETITYTYTVTNTSGADLIGVQLTDDRIASEQISCDSGPDLAIGASFTCHATATMTADALTNTATAHGTYRQFLDGSPTDYPVQGTTASVTVTPPAPPTPTPSTTPTPTPTPAPTVGPTPPPTSSVPPPTSSAPSSNSPVPATSSSLPTLPPTVPAPGLPSTGGATEVGAGVLLVALAAAWGAQHWRRR